MGDKVVEQAIDNVRKKSKGNSTPGNYRVTINFHPDRYTTTGIPLLLAIAQDGCLKSQFETATSNGGLSAYKGGERWLWEQKAFDDAYNNADNRLRPKYGALNFREYQTGASCRFGSAYFELKPQVLERTTFCYPDSYFTPEDFAVSGQLGSLIDKANASNDDLLDDYIEAHIHGVLSIKDDIECLVLDPCYHSSVVEEHALKLGVPVKWHKGYELSLESMSLYPDYRGQRFIELAKEIAQNGFINPRLLGIAITQQGYDEQDIKKIWHYLARFGYSSI